MSKVIIVTVNGDEFVTDSSTFDTSQLKWFEDKGDFVLFIDSNKDVILIKKENIAYFIVPKGSSA